MGTRRQYKRAVKKSNRSGITGVRSLAYGPKKHAFGHATPKQVNPKIPKILGAHPLHSSKAHAMTGAKLTPTPNKRHIFKPPKPPKMSKHRI